MLKAFFLIYIFVVLVATIHIVVRQEDFLIRHFESLPRFMQRQIVKILANQKRYIYNVDLYHKIVYKNSIDPSIKIAIIGLLKKTPKRQFAFGYTKIIERYRDQLPHLAEQAQEALSELEKKM